MARALAEVCSQIVEAIARVDAFVDDFTDDQITADGMRVWAIQRGLEIISEAVRNIPGDDRSRHPHIPWRRIEDFGNWLRHQYDSVDNSIILSIVRNDLEPLRQAIHDISPIVLPDCARSRT